MKTRTAYSWMMVGLVAVNFCFLVVRTFVSHSKPFLAIGLTVLVASLVAALAMRRGLTPPDEREAAIAMRASNAAFQWAFYIAMAGTMVLPFVVTAPDVPMHWLMQAPMLFLMVQLMLRFGAEAVLLASPNE